MNNAEPNAQYRHALVEDFKLPMGPDPTMRSLLRIAAAWVVSMLSQFSGVC